MDNKNSEKTAAEIYREERKKRIEKAAKKNAKNTPELAMFKKRVGKIIAFVLVAAIVLGCVYGILNFFGVPQKVLTVSTVDGGSQKNEKISVAELNYYYVTTYQQIANTAYSYDQQYGSGMGKMYTGFDYTLAPDAQEYTVSKLDGFEDGQTAYWSDYIRINAINSIHETEASYIEAVAAGYKLSDDDQKQIDETVDSLRSTAKENDFSLNRYLIYRFGKGVDEKLLREVMAKQLIAQAYLQDKYTEVSDSQTAEAIEKEYNDNKSAYALVDLRAFTIAANAETTDEMSDEEKQAATEAAMEKAKKTADAALKTITDEESFLAAAKANVAEGTTFSESSTLLTGTTYASLQSTYGANTADWTYDSERKVGDTAVIEGNGRYVITYMVKLPYKDETLPVNVRHILFSFEMDENNQVTSTDEEKAAIKEQAESVLAQFKEDPSEEAFAELAKQYSGDEGSKENGGLYENITSSTNFVENFKNWALDKDRKAGDVDIVETEYGYHIMYFVGASEDAVWYTNIKTALADSAFEGIYNDMTAKHPAKDNEKLVNWSVKKINTHINDYMIAH